MLTKRKRLYAGRYKGVKQKNMTSYVHSRNSFYSQVWRLLCARHCVFIIFNLVDFKFGFGTPGLFSQRQLRAFLVETI